MACTIDVPSRSPTPRKRLVLFVSAILALSGGTALVYDSWPASRKLRIHERETGSPYKNMRLGVKYVGDAACIGCHSEIARTYRNHPMGRSLSPIGSAPTTAGPDAGSGPLFVAQGFEYSVENRNGHVIHKATRRDASGRVIAQTEGEVRFVVGSGRMGIAHLIERDGFLFQSPIAWYARDRRWGLPPGYERSNRHFDLPIQSVCLFCHANRSEPVEGTVNRYQPPFFAGHAIGCERCHGPGELHAAHPNLVRRPGLDDRESGGPGARTPGCRLPAMPPERAETRPAQAVAMRTIGRACRFSTSGRSSRVRAASSRTASSASSSRCIRAAASRPARAASDALPATIRIGCRSRTRLLPTSGIAAWSATPNGVAACRRRSGQNEGGPTTASVATCRDWRTPTLSMLPRRTTGSPAARTRPGGRGPRPRIRTATGVRG